MKYLFLIAIIFYACGSDDSESSGSLGDLRYTSWKSNSSLFSGYVFEFYDDKFLAYTYRNDGKLGQLQLVRGLYSVSGNTITMTPTEFDCGEIETVYTVRMEGETMTMAQDEMMISVKRTDPVSIPNFLRGCFDENSNFTYL